MKIRADSGRFYSVEIHNSLIISIKPFKTGKKYEFTTHRPPECVDIDFNIINLVNKFDEDLAEIKQQNEIEWNNWS